MSTLIQPSFQKKKKKKKATLINPALPLYLIYFLTIAIPIRAFPLGDVVHQRGSFIFQVSLFPPIPFSFTKKKVEIAQTVATQPRQLHYSNNLSKKRKNFSMLQMLSILFRDLYVQWTSLMCLIFKGVYVLINFSFFSLLFFFFFFFSSPRFVCFLFFFKYGASQKGTSPSPIFPSLKEK